MVKRCLPAIASLLALAAPANAAVTVGQAHFRPYSDCSNQTYIQIAADGNSYTVPSAGVLTSWTLRTGDNTIVSAKLKVARAQGGANFLIVGEAAAGAQTINTPTTYPTRISVQAGDVLGLYALDGDCDVPSMVFADQFRYLAADPPPNTTAAFSNQFDGVRVPVAAQLEPDADGDGYGDESQDGCPTDATLQDACRVDLALAASADRPRVAKGENVVLTFAVRNDSTSPAQAAHVSTTLPGGLRFISATPSQGACAGGGGCDLGTIAPKSTAVITLVARAVAKGTATTSAVLTAATTDPNALNNNVTVATKIGGGFGGIALPGGSAKVKKGKVRLRRRCPATAAGHCVGTDRLRAGKKVVGSKAFKIAAGKRGLITIKLSKKARRAVSKRGHLKVREVMVAHDDSGVNARTSASLKLVRP